MNDLERHLRELGLETYCRSIAPDLGVRPDDWKANVTTEQAERIGASVYEAFRAMSAFKEGYEEQIAKLSQAKLMQQQIAQGKVKLPPFPTKPERLNKGECVTSNCGGRLENSWTGIGTVERSFRCHYCGTRYNRHHDKHWSTGVFNKDI